MKKPNYKVTVYEDGEEQRVFNDESVIVIGLHSSGIFTNNQDIAQLSACVLASFRVLLLNCAKSMHVAPTVALHIIFALSKNLSSVEVPELKHILEYLH